MRGLLLLAESSMSRETAAAVKDLVVEAVWKRVEGVTLSSGKVAMPYPCRVQLTH